MLIEKPVLEAVFVKRPNRFQGYVMLDNKEIMTHVPNTGRCKEILIPGTKVILRKEDSPERKTQYDLIAAYKGENLISIDSHIPNKVVHEALINKMIPSLEKYNIIMREKTFGNSRFDFKLSDDIGNEYYLEVKGVTLEKNGVASFPDAPTERGRKHLMELVEAKRQGKGAGVIFLIQLDDIKAFTPHDETDPEFGEALRYAAKNGVDVFAYCSEVNPDSITLKREVQVIL